MKLSAATPWTETERLAFEKETLGLYLSGHPMDRYMGELKAFGARSTAELAELPIAAPTDNGWTASGPKPIEPDTSIGGIVAACRQLKTRKGDRMAVFTLEDSQGGVEVIAFPEAYQRASALIETGTMVLVRGKLERDDESVRILASEIVPIAAVRERLAREVAIRVQDAGRPPGLRGARRDLRAASRRSARVVRPGRARPAADRGPRRSAAAAGQGRDLVADSRPPLVQAHRRSGAGRRAGSVSLR